MQSQIQWWHVTREGIRKPPKSKKQDYQTSNFWRMALDVMASTCKTWWTLCFFDRNMTLKIYYLHVLLRYFLLLHPQMVHVYCLYNSYFLCKSEAKYFFILSMRNCNEKYKITTLWDLQHVLDIHVSIPEIGIFDRNVL